MLFVQAHLVPYHQIMKVYTTLRGWIKGTAQSFYTVEPITVAGCRRLPSS